MKCKIDGCGNDVRYKAAKLCQKHYFRIMRNGMAETIQEMKMRTLGRSRQYRVVMPGRGYQRLYEPDHPLSDKAGYIAEGRFVVFALYGYVLPPCELCGKPMSWDEDIHIDHKDDDVTNNRQDNLRPLCRPCNTGRGRMDECEYPSSMAITIDGKTMTPTEWARESGVKVHGATIRRRKRMGLSDYDAVFSPKKTHNKS